jgi:hypothetical protein
MCSRETARCHHIVIRTSPPAGEGNASRGHAGEVEAGLSVKVATTKAPAGAAPAAPCVKHSKGLTCGPRGPDAAGWERG